ncbi:uncharacterized protein BJ212DRAFT_1302727 [Suillus subaureus]|uniref:CxC2-like cysteine cluster KDZ transposase-associated domain-containing protein n=1 Tax=Suillus subaureus TaxID=48587 RepID=A0A9P7J960_9AGAM|nr:uncharacterized protein BJ212DRAFT_1302727 [Suillus subaureus]KAG1809164.1 hypothetical protein BJ212DRAFT_1302727 [Suillus subaureus]
MSQSGCTGCPSKHPKLIRHTQPDTTQPLNHVNRHHMFSLQPSGQLALRTSYIPATLPEKEDENAGTLMPALPFPLKMILGTRWCPSTLHPRWTMSLECLRCQWLKRDAGELQDFYDLKEEARIQTPHEWRGRFFHPVSLKSMGLRIQLGHPPGITCCRPTPAFGDDFMIINVHSVHPTGLDFCGCEQEVSHFKQLLHVRLFPSMVTDPRMVATFAVLEFFHILSFESKVSAYEFYHSLAQWTDNTGITPIHIYLHKRSGSLLSISKDSP